MENLRDTFKGFIKNNKKEIGVIIFILISIIIFGIWFYANRHESVKKEEVVVEKTEPLVIEKEEVVETEEPVLEEVIIPKVLVDIKGQVNNPGIYQVEETARVQDVINIAGGLTDEADTATINLSKKVFDEMVIIVYAKEVKTKEPEVTKDTLPKLEISNNAIIQEEDLTKNPSKETENDTQLISINQATKEEFMKLPGIGESKADQIIKYRDENGFFEEIEDLKKVSGIGDSVFEKIKSYLTI